MCYSAQSATAIRRNAVWQPLYSLAYFFIILLGFAALLAGVQPPDNNLNAALLQFVATSYPAWVIGLVAGTGFLLALVPGSLLLLSAGTIFTRNIAQPICGALSEAASLRLSRAALVCFAALAAFLSISDGSSLVRILLNAYAAIGAGAAGVLGIPVAARDGIRRAGRAGGGFRRLAGAVRVQLLVPRRARMGAGIDRHGHQCAGPDSRESSDADAATVRGGHRHSFNVAPSPRRKSNNLTR